MSQSLTVERGRWQRAGKLGGCRAGFCAGDGCQVVKRERVKGAGHDVSEPSGGVISSTRSGSTRMVACPWVEART